LEHKKLFIEDWLPAQALSIECMREENNPIAKPPHSFLHVWWARRPLTVSRAAVLASLLPADFDREVFERLLGFYASSNHIVAIAKLIASKSKDEWVEEGHGKRAFSNSINEPDLNKAYQAMIELWGELPTVLDPMAGGGSIPFESARLGLTTLANEYNPVACSILETTVDYPFHFGELLAEKTKKWGKIWERRFDERMYEFYPYDGISPPRNYIFARTVPCPDTGHPTPLVNNWYLLKKRGGQRIVAEPLILDADSGSWTVTVKEIGKRAGQLQKPPQPTYGRGKGISLFTKAPLSSDYIKAMAQQGKMGYRLYAVATKATKIDFRPPQQKDFEALEAAEKELARKRDEWERNGIIPTEEFPEVCSDPRPRIYGMQHWSDMFAPRQLLALGTLVEELRNLRLEIVEVEGEELGEAVVHLLSFVLDKVATFNSNGSRWITQRGVIAQRFERHDFSFKATIAEMAMCVTGSGLEWTIENVCKAYRGLAKLPRSDRSSPVGITQGSATALYDLDDESVTAVVVDPPYADNVQYSELADFFYVWLKRTQGYRRPEWFMSELCEKDEEAVVNISRYRDKDISASSARDISTEFYQDMMKQVFGECHRVLRDDGVLTVMFTHKTQEAWASLFKSLISAGFTITATWPIKTESQHSLHQARKNAAQSSVLLVARKRHPGAGIGYFDDETRSKIRKIARSKAAVFKEEGLNAIDQLVGAFGPAMQVFTSYDEVRTDLGEVVEVSTATQAAADAVAEWRVEQLSERGLEGIDPESRFILLCWDVLGAVEFRFNEAMLLGRSVGMDVNELFESGLVSKSGDKVKLLPASERRREREIRTEEEQLEIFEFEKGRKKYGSRTIHPNDEYFATAIDMCHALALRHAEAGGGQAGIGAARGLARQQNWTADHPCAKLMCALVNATPDALKFGGKKKKTVADEFPEFRAWHSMLKPLFQIEPPEWKEPEKKQLELLDRREESDE